MTVSSAAADVAWDRAVRAGQRAFLAARHDGDTIAVEAAIAVALATYGSRPADQQVHSLRVRAPSPQLSWCHGVCRCGWEGDLHRGHWAAHDIDQDYDRHLDAI